ncbi:DUF2853 family protein [Palleronia sediminis]|uniref:DUF2853 family protein n=1 Tax=Palleronia sediminis TaxID=2547833 RepID=A0A4R6A932_9RHOB|nr:DUF2853 family protein [Palleronia sediminis]TDL79395.1 DUF2853 family protein [Palleronia sediminis]
MGKRDDLIEKYAADLRETCGVEPDMELLRKVTIGCGPAIYREDASTVAASDTQELKRIEDGFLRKKLGLPESDSLMGGIQEVLRIYGRSNRNKYRAVVYYLLVKHFDRESVYT